MGLSIHVMPLWKFWAGQVPDTVIAGMKAVVVRRVPLDADVDAARLEERKLMEFLQRRDARLGWSQKDEVVFSRRFPSYDMLHALRAFAAHQTFPTRRWFRPQPFQPVADWSRHPALLRLRAPGDYAHRHLIFHAPNGGWYLPAEFSDPFELASDANQEGISVGSAERLCVELRVLERATRQVAEADLRSALAAAVEFLLTAASASVEHRLPMIYDG